MHDSVLCISVTYLKMHGAGGSLHSIVKHTIEV